MTANEINNRILYTGFVTTIINLASTKIYQTVRMHYQITIVYQISSIHHGC